MTSYLVFCIQIPQDLQSVTVRELQPMRISVQSGVATSDNIVWHESSSKTDNPNDAVHKDNSPDGAQRNAAEMDIKKTKTIQHLLCDWRTAYTKSKKVILFIFFLTYNSDQFIFRKQQLGK